MKNIIVKIFAIFIIAVGLSGCYTIVWTPKDNFPTAENSDYQDNGYYTNPYYGDYNYYYNYPWWYSMAPPAQSYVRDQNQGQQNLRNGMEGRGNTSRTGILQTELPAYGTSSAATGASGTPINKDSSGNRIESKNTGTTNTARPTSSTNNNTLRNNDGSRNNNGRK